ncbi:MAG TPA: hypothetical protein VF443_12760, partial [Nitrospira sp.]
LAGQLRRGAVTPADLRLVQERRSWPTQMTQRMQLLLQDRVIKGVLAGDGPLVPPWPLRLIARFPILRRIPARLIGMGFRPEHVRTSAVR